jgi:uncharacterized protein (DUF2344 family)
MLTVRYKIQTGGGSEEIVSPISQKIWEIYGEDSPGFIGIVRFETDSNFQQDDYSAEKDDIRQNDVGIVPVNQFDHYISRTPSSTAIKTGNTVTLTNVQNWILLLLSKLHTIWKFLTKRKPN